MSAYPPMPNLQGVEEDTRNQVHENGRNREVSVVTKTTSYPHYIDWTIDSRSLHIARLAAKGDKRGVIEANVERECHRFKLELCASGWRNSQDGYSAFYLTVSETDTPFVARYRVQVGDITRISSIRHDFHLGVGFPNFCEQSALENILQNGNLKFIVTVEVFNCHSEVLKTQKTFDMILNKNNPINNALILSKMLQDIYSNRLHTDVTLVCGGDSHIQHVGNATQVLVPTKRKKIYAHKCILAAASPVFKAMFEHSCVESIHSQVRLHEFAPETVEAMVKFLYTARLDDNYINNGNNNNNGSNIVNGVSGKTRRPSGSHSGNSTSPQKNSSGSLVVENDDNVDPLPLDDDDDDEMFDDSLSEYEARPGREVVAELSGLNDAQREVQQVANATTDDGALDQDEVGSNISSSPEPPRDSTQQRISQLTITSPARLREQQRQQQRQHDRDSRMDENDAKESSFDNSTRGGFRQAFVDVPDTRVSLPSTDYRELESQGQPMRTPMGVDASSALSLANATPLPDTPTDENIDPNHNNNNRPVHNYHEAVYYIEQTTTTTTNSSQSRENCPSPPPVRHQISLHSQNILPLQINQSNRHQYPCCAEKHKHHPNPHSHAYCHSLPDPNQKVLESSNTQSSKKHRHHKSSSSGEKRNQTLSSFSFSTSTLALASSSATKVESKKKSKHDNNKKGGKQERSKHVLQVNDGVNSGRCNTNICGEYENQDIFNLFQFAEMYKIESLVIACCQEMHSKLNVNSTCDLLIRLDRYSHVPEIKLMQESMWEYIRENIREIKKTNGFQRLLKYHPTILEQLIDRVITK